MIALVTVAAQRLASLGRHPGDFLGERFSEFRMSERKARRGGLHATPWALARVDACTEVEAWCSMIDDAADDRTAFLRLVQQMDSCWVDDTLKAVWRPVRHTLIRSSEVSKLWRWAVPERADAEQAVAELRSLVLRVARSLHEYKSRQVDMPVLPKML